MVGSILQNMTDAERKEQQEKSLGLKLQHCSALFNSGNYSALINNLSKCIIDANILADIAATETDT